MFNFAVSQFFTGLWPLVLHYGFFVSAIGGCLVFAWFSPVFKKTALWIAGGILIGLICYQAGVNNGESRIRAQWKLSEDQSVKVGKAARARAVWDVAHSLSRMRKPAADKYDRD